MTSEQRRTFGRYLARLRGDRTQAALADQLNALSGTGSLTRHDVSRWERGDRIPDVWLPHLAQAHDVPLTVLERAAAQARGKDPAGEQAPDLTPFFPAGHTVKTRLAGAWHGRAATGAAGKPLLILVGGYAGSGKTEFARFLADLSGWAYLDKDALTRRLTERLLISLGSNPNDRHTDTYRREVRPLEYRTLLSAAHGNLEAGVPIILAAPFVLELRDPAWKTRLTHRCAAQGIDLTAIWMHCDPASMHDYLEARNAPRDTWKLAHWDEYLATTTPDDPPPTADITIDNRHGAAIGLAEQTRQTLHRLTR